jgi:hypothetical protein
MVNEQQIAKYVDGNGRGINSGCFENDTNGANEGNVLRFFLLSSNPID